MNLKKKIISITILIIMFLGIIYKPILVKADSGFDSSWDSGSSYDSGSSWDSGSSSDSSSGLDNDYSPGDSIARLIMVIIIFSFLFFLSRLTTEIKRQIKLDKLYNKKHNSNKINSALYSKLISTFPDFDLDKFNNNVFNYYKDIQIAWMNFDLESIRNIISDEIYNMYNMQLETLKVKGQKNIMKDFIFISNDISNIEFNNDHVTIKTILHVTCKDYLINNSNKVIRGNKKRIMDYTYRLTFTRSINKNIDKCPSCGAKININTTGKCEFCKSIISNNESEWILTKKEMLKQRQV